VSIISKDPKSIAVSQVQSDDRICWKCGITASSLLKCSGCRKARYCGESCQREDWGKHKDWCGKRKEIREKRKRIEKSQESQTQIHEGQMDEVD
jgi:hypothetical protein